MLTGGNGNKKKQNQRQATGDTVILKTTGEVVVDSFQQKSPILGGIAVKQQNLVGKT